jgi:hypothetical protein
MLLFSMFVFLLPASSYTIFSDAFLSGTFSAWSSTYANPTISSGIATFTVTGGDGAGCYVIKNQLPLSSADVFSVSSRVRFNTIPTTGQGNSAIIFTEIFDPSNSKVATVYAFVDGSQHFGLWIGEWPNYITVYDTATVQANTYYNVTIQLDNLNHQFKLIIDGQTKITQSYTEYSAFQNSSHVTLIEGITKNYAWATVQVWLDYVMVTHNSEVSYSISASAGAGGSISPLGEIQVLAGGSQTFTISPNIGYLISQVTVDGQNQGAINSYTFTNIQSNHIITTSFIASTFSDGFESGSFNAWTGTLTSNGVISTSTARVYEGKYAARGVVYSDGGRAVVYKDLPNSSTIYLQAYIWIDLQLISNGGIAKFVELLNDWTVGSRFGIKNNAGTLNYALSYRDNVNNEIFTTSTETVTLGAWHQIEIAVYADVNSGWSKLWVDGLPVINNTNINTGTTINRIDIGAIDFLSIAYFDKVTITNSIPKPTLFQLPQVLAAL